MAIPYENATSVPQGRNEALLMRDEAKQLAAYHKIEGDYAQGCYWTQKRIANDEPMHTSPEHQTKADWLNSANGWKERRNYHRKRARFWNKFLDANDESAADEGRLAALVSIHLAQT